MSRPTTEELDTALAMAAQMRDKKNDPFFLAKALLSENYRAKCMHDVLLAADRYLNMGMSESERTRLMRAIEKAKDAEAYTSSQARNDFGLE
jgi:hypothetical protein